MRHDHVMTKLNFGLFTPWVRGWGVCGQTIYDHGAEVTGQLRVNGEIRHLRRCTLEDQSLALKRKHRVHKYVNTETIFVYIIKLFILT